MKLTTITGLISGLALSTAPALANAGAIIHSDELPGCDASFLGRNDDGSTGQVDIGFTINFFGVSYSKLYVNNNGNVTFDGPLSTYTPFPISTTGTKIIAPFFGDVDTRNTGSDVVRYGRSTLSGHRVFCVNWDGIGVGYYSSRVDKLNKFQLILVERSDVAAGDFDIYFNYDQIQWEAGQASGGTNGLGGSSARAGYSNGNQATSLELPGSAINGAFLDTNLSTGLKYNSRESTTPGRYIFQVHNGDVPAGSVLSGVVRDPQNQAVAGAPVQICHIPVANVAGGENDCQFALSNASGVYTLFGIAPGDYDVQALSPAGRDLLPSAYGFFTAIGNQSYLQDLRLTAPLYIPQGSTIEPSRGNPPVVYWHDALTLRTHGCEGGVATYVVTQGNTDIRHGQLFEYEPGSYEATIEPFYPLHGYARVTLTLSCPDGQTGSSGFDIYIDPSGRVLDNAGNAVEGATVTLLRGDTAAGPFVTVPGGSAIMSPSNRTNPMLSSATGGYGWDVISGFYVVEAFRADCGPAVRSRVLEIPPPALDVNLVLACRPVDVTPPVLTLPQDITAEATSANGAAVTFSATAVDNVDGAVNVTCTPASGSQFALGTTAVSCSAADRAGNGSSGSFNVTVRDTTAPAISTPTLAATEATGPLGAAVSYTVSATDLVDGSVSVSCAPASGSTFAIGVTQVNCTASDAAGNSASAAFNVEVVDTTAPALTLPGDLSAYATSAAGAPVSFSATASDIVDGSVAVFCTAASGDIFGLGTTTVSCTATDTHNNSATGTFTVTVTYSATGVLQPIAADGSSVFKLGRTIPVKFSLTGPSAGITNAVARLYLAQVSTTADGTEVEAVSTSAATTGNLFRSADGVYIFNLATSGLSQGTWIGRIDLGDGVLRTFRFGLRP